MRRFTKIGTLFGLAAIATAPIAVHAADALDANAGWALLKQCAMQTDDAARHACTDGVLRRAGLLASGGQAPAATASNGSTPAWYSAAAPATVRAAATAQEPEQIEVTLASVQSAADRKLLLTTSDGAVWKQMESQTLIVTPQQGQTMIVKRKSLGSFMCEPGKYVSFRCYRIR